MVVEGLQTCVHGEKPGMVAADHRGQEGEGGGEFFKFCGILGTADLKVFGIHKGVGTGLKVGELGDLAVDLIGSGSAPGENLDGQPVLPELAENW